MLKHQAEPVLYRVVTENVIPEVIVDHINVQNPDVKVKRAIMERFIVIPMLQSMQEKLVIKYAVPQDVMEEPRVVEAIVTNIPALSRVAIQKEQAVRTIVVHIHLLRKAQQLSLQNHIVRHRRRVRKHIMIHMMTAMIQSMKMTTMIGIDIGKMMITQRA